MGSFVSRPENIGAAVGAAAAVAGFMHWYNWSFRYPTGAALSYGYVPFLGHMLRVLQGKNTVDDMLTDFNNQTAKGESRTVVFAIPTLPWMIITGDKRNVEYILKTNFENFPKGEFFSSIFFDLLGHGIFNADGERWWQQRKTSSPMFSTKVLKHHFSVFTERCKDLVKVMKKNNEEGKNEELFSLFNRFTLECIGEVGFGVSIGCLNDPSHPFLAAFDSAQELTAGRILNPAWPLLRLFNVGPEARLKKCVQLMDKFTYDLIVSRRFVVTQALERGEYADDKIISAIIKANPRAVKVKKEKGMTRSYTTALDDANEDTKRANKMTSDISTAVQSPDREGQSEDHTPDFLTLFIASQPELTNRELRDSVVSLLIAGRDTSAQTLAWVFWELLNHFEVMQKCREELMKVVGHETWTKSKETGETIVPDFEMIRTQMPYLNAVVHEALRLHPPVHRNFKQANEDCVMPDGTLVPAGSIVVYTPWAMARDPEVWGADFNEFKPDRWLNMNHLPSNYVWPVFQGGPRECLGRAMALFEVRACICSIIGNFDLTPQCDMTKHTYTESATHGMSHPLTVSATYNKNILPTTA